MRTTVYGIGQVRRLKSDPVDIIIGLRPLHAERPRKRRPRRIFEGRSRMFPVQVTLQVKVELWSRWPLRFPPDRCRCTRQGVNVPVQTTEAMLAYPSCWQSGSRQGG